MINDLDATLARLLRSNLPPEWADQVQISFAAPDSQFPPQSVALPAIDLFLYDVRENLELRSNDLSTQRRSDGTALQRRPPVRVDFSYLVTAWPSESVAGPWEDEHRLLGEVMRALLQHRTIPQELLAGSLALQETPLPVSSLQAGRLHSPGEFWQAMGGKPKVALHYTVTASVETDAQVVPLVIDKHLGVGILRHEVPQPAAG
ncbi:DUF4255 domain-containing protein [Pseudorhodoferax sp.]|uniref:DUF4255 domain-containing protein n=1 Tax=Pseudorhodoferax sp. TaxID=1993553 RepID=UPI002DD64168|nr:DUF4255 domain-containing protein [Pseudorhodoferax sp.]